jgi:hypothetical protein
VVRAYHGLTSRPELAALYARGRAFYEVPFVSRHGESVARGLIDCLICSAAGSPAADGRSKERVTILEFKTGSARPEHQIQAMAYKQAVESMFPQAEVEAQLVYLDGMVDV